MFESNLGTIDKIARLVIGLCVASLAFWGPENKIALLGMILVFTGAVNFCPIYKVLGLSTKNV